MTKNLPVNENIFQLRGEEKPDGALDEFGRGTFPGKEKGSVSKPLDGEGMRRRVEAALRKAKLGEKMTQKEIMIVQWVSSIGNCSACYALRRTERDDPRGRGER